MALDPTRYPNLALAVGDPSRVPPVQLIGSWQVLSQSAVPVSASADTNEDTLATITVPANAMGLNGSLRVSAVFTVTNSVNNKTIRVRFGGASGTQYAALTMTTSTSAVVGTMISNRGAANSQVGSPSTGRISGAEAGAVVTSSVDTTADSTIVITGAKASSGEAITLERYSVELAYGA